MTNYSDYITIDPKIAFGKPVIKGTRISVDFIVDLYAGGQTSDEILKGYPHLNQKQLEAALNYAAARLRKEHIYLLDNMSPQTASNETANQRKYPHSSR